ncbi:MAG: hypothetical protein AAF447_13230 [Myxococcota bacterium]
MTVQDVLAALTVAGAVAFLGWKFGPGTRVRRGKATKRGPDVPTRDLLRKQRRP